MVVEFGRRFEGELGFLEAPAWRNDLKWLADRAGALLWVERGRGMSLLADGDGTSDVVVKMPEVHVKCVILTRGGEQA